MNSSLPHTPVEKRAQALKPDSRRPVESISRTASPTFFRNPRSACPIMWANSAPNTAAGRTALASARVERRAGWAPR